MSLAAATRWPAVLALVFNAFAWGVSWWPFRHFEQLGLHPLWLTALIYALVVLAVLAVRPGALIELLRTPALWLLVLAAGTTNASFNWAVTLGDVVRVVLLFYLMPLWAVLLARPLLGERLGWRAGLRVALALAGALIVLWPAAEPAAAALAGAGTAMTAGAASAHAAAPTTTTTSTTTTAAWAVTSPLGLADVLALIGGFSFALNNVMLRREARRSESARALAMFAGGAIVSAGLALLLGAAGGVPNLPPPQAAWLWGVLALAVWFLLGNLALQYGAARLPAHTTAVVMITEVLFASATAIAWGAGTLGLQAAAGGTLIVAAAVLAAWQSD